MSVKIDQEVTENYFTVDRLNITRTRNSFKIIGEDSRHRKLNFSSVTGLLISGSPPSNVADSSSSITVPESFQEVD